MRGRGVEVSKTLFYKKVINGRLCLLVFVILVVV